MKKFVKKIARRLGYDIITFKPEELGKYPYADMKKFVTVASPIILDIGANKGQTVRKIHKIFPEAIIHSFEPSPSTFEILKKTVGDLDSVNVWNNAVGSETGELQLLENKFSDMSSFLELGSSGWGEIRQKTNVNILTVDQFRIENELEMIDILKVDTQGFELEVFKGAEQSMLQNKIGMVYFEVTFSNIYENLPSFGMLYDYLTEKGYSIVAIYPINYRDGKAGWTDVLFMNNSYDGS